MRSEPFAALLSALPEPHLLVSEDAEIRALNTRAASLLDGADGLVGESLYDITTDPRDAVATLLRQWARTRATTPGALTLRGAGGQPERFRCEGAVVRPWTAERPASILIRLRRHETASGRFLSLNRQIHRLTKEIHERRRIEARLRESKQELEQARDAAEAEAARTRALQAATAGLAGAATPQDVADVLVRRGAATIGATGGALMRVDDDGHWMDIIHTHDVPDEVAERWRRSRASGEDPTPSRDVIRTGEPVFLRSPEAWRARYPHLASEFEAAGATALAYLPLQTGERILGVLALRFATERPFDEDDRRLLRSLAGLGGQGLERARLYAAERTAWRRAHELVEAGRVLASSLDYEETLQQVARLTAEMLGDYAGVDLIEPTGEVRRVAAAHVDPEQQKLVEQLKRYPPDMEKDVGIARALRTGEPMMINDVPDELIEAATHDAQHLRIAHALGVRALLVAPMTARRRVVGALTAVSAAPDRRFGPEDIAFARELADRAALALDNARLYRRSRDAVRARDDVLAVVSHDLRTPLGVVYTSARMMLETDQPEARRREFLDRQLRAVKQAERLIDDLLEIARSEAGQLILQRHPVPPDRLLAAVRDDFEEQARGAGIEIRVAVDGDPPSVHADPDRALRILGNLVSNAVKHTPEGGVVGLRAQPAPGGVAFHVSDSGPGIPEREREHIFERFWQASRSGRAGAGLGLAIAKELVEAHGGSIWVDRAEGGGTTFGFTLPEAVEAVDDGG